jgi:hypothetical protein
MRAAVLGGLAATACLVFAGCASTEGGSSSSSGSAKTGANHDAVNYIRNHGQDAGTVAAMVSVVEIDAGQFGTSGSVSDLQSFSADAQRAHDGLDNIRDSLAELDSGKLGDAEAEVFGAANDLKNDMGAFVAATSDPTGGQMAAAGAKFQEDVATWNDGVRTIWRLAHRKHAPTI